MSFYLSDVERCNLGAMDFLDHVQTASYCYAMDTPF